MSWRERRGAIVGAVLAATLAGLLAACNVEPLYGHRPMAAGFASPARAGGVAAKLAAVQVVPIEGRVGQTIRNDLIYRFTGGDNPAPMRYRLAIVLKATPQFPVIDPFTERPEVETVTLDTVWALIPFDSDKPALSGNAFGRANLNRNRQRFADLSAEQDAEDRASQVIADQIYTRLAAYFSNLSRPDGLALANRTRPSEAATPRRH